MEEDELDIDDFNDGMNDILEVVNQVNNAFDRQRDENIRKKMNADENSDDEEDDDDEEAEEITIIMGTGETLEIKNIEEIINKSVNNTEKKKSKDGDQNVYIVELNLDDMKNLGKENEDGDIEINLEDLLFGDGSEIFEGMYGYNLLKYCLKLEQDEVLPRGEAFKILSMSIEWPADIMIDPYVDP